MGIAGLALSGCAPTPSASGLLPYGYRYRLSVHLDAFGKRYSASGVQQYRFRRGIKALGSMDSGGVGIVGEAISVAMVPHGVLAFTLADTEQQRAEFGNRWPVDSIAKRAYGAGFRTQAAIGYGPIKPISIGDLPLAVFFQDPSDPSSVAPLNTIQDIVIRSATLSITRAAIAKGVIDYHLPWLNRYISEGRYLDGEKTQSAEYGRPFSTSLSTRDFKSRTY